MRLDEIGVVSWLIADKAGWHDRPTGDMDRVGLQLALVHSEVSEALDAYRHRGLEAWHKPDGKPEGMASELADVIIRVAELAHDQGIDLHVAVQEKIAYNRIRADVPNRSDTTKKF